MTDYPDTNGNGIPDAFEHRSPISVILNRDPSSIVQSKRDIDAVGPALDYRLFVGDAPTGKAVLLEVRTLLTGSEYGACVFRSEGELREFIRQLYNAGHEAFDMQGE